MRKWLSRTTGVCLPFGPLASLWNETRAPGSHHIIEPAPGFDTIDLLKCILRKGGNVEILPRACRSFGVVSNAVPRCTAQANSTCAGVFPIRAAIADITVSSSGPGLIPWPKGAKARSTMSFAWQNSRSSVSGR